MRLVFLVLQSVVEGTLPTSRIKTLANVSQIVSAMILDHKR